MVDIQLHLGDCLTLMRSMPDKSVDAVITSPPFNLGNDHHTGNNRHAPYDDDLPEELYQSIQGTILNEIYRLLRDGGSVFYQHKNRIKNGRQITPYEWLLRGRLVIKQELVWRNGSQNFDKIRFYPQTERVYWLTKSPETTIYNSINATDLFYWQPEGIDKEHKRSFPLELPKTLLYCLPDEITVFDPFMGSGTTGVACVQTGRNFIGCEISENYFKIAEKRIAEAQLQERMPI